LLTTSRYASPNGRFFFPDGVLPSVEVKRPDLAATLPEDTDTEPSPTPSVENKPASPTPAPAGAVKPTEDVILKKAIEVMTTKAKKKAS
jgi:hypothetical protein